MVVGLGMVVGAVALHLVAEALKPDHEAVIVLQLPMVGQDVLGHLLVLNRAILSLVLRLENRLFIRVALLVHRLEHFQAQLLSCIWLGEEELADQQRVQVVGVVVAIPTNRLRDFLTVLVFQSQSAREALTMGLGANRVIMVARLLSVRI